jgi:hypothetical protein
MYYPTFRPQLTGVPTQGVDCGVRATQMMLDWLSKGKVIRSVKAIREAMGDQDETNYTQWDMVIDQLGGQTLGFSGETTNSYERAEDHMNRGGAVIWAVHYGTMRAKARSKVGSPSFSGYHAILTIGSRMREQRQWRSFDSLLDGRYLGCPQGPIWVPAWVIRTAAQEVGAREAGSRKTVYALLGHRSPDIIGTEPGDLLPGQGMTLSDVLVELRDIYAGASGDTKLDLAALIEDYEALLGVTGNPEADISTRVEPGIALEGGS